MIIRAIRWTTAVALLLLLGACAERPGRGGSTPAAYPYAPDDLVLQIAWTGGFVTPQTVAGRLPVVSVYGDGRVIGEGPVPAIFPGPALPNLQVRRIGTAEVQALVDRALEAGVGETGDLGTPPLADAPATRFTVSTGLETIVREVYALREAGDAPAGLTPAQVAARAELRAFLDELTDTAAAATEAYAPAAVAAVVSPYTPPEETYLTQPDLAWPGPALPGEPLEERLGLSCVVATGAQAAGVLDAARAANALTPWRSADDTRWSLLLRPLLPHESGCADLRGS